jgi:hypothetical protein
LTAAESVGLRAGLADWTSCVVSGFRLPPRPGRTAGGRGRTSGPRAAPLRRSRFCRATAAASEIARDVVGLLVEDPSNLLGVQALPRRDSQRCPSGNLPRQCMERRARLTRVEGVHIVHNDHGWAVQRRQVEEKQRQNDVPRSRRRPRAPSTLQHRVAGSTSAPRAAGGPTAAPGRRPPRPARAMTPMRRPPRVGTTWPRVSSSLSQLSL